MDPSWVWGASQLAMFDDIRGVPSAQFPPWLRAAPALGLRPHQSHPLSHRPGLNNMKLVGGIPTPLKNMSQWEELLFPTYGKIKNVPKHQPAQICENSTNLPPFFVKIVSEKNCILSWLSICLVL